MLRDQDEFLLIYNKRKEFESEKFKNTGLTWDDLEKVAESYEQFKTELEKTIKEYSSRLQNIPNVKYLGFRLKDTEHLIEKIIRKVAKRGKIINVNNYKEEITDLMGIRLVYISKYDAVSVFEKIVELYRQDVVEVALKYRAGDDLSPYVQILKSDYFDVKKEETERYRSVHFTLKTHIGTCLEIQTRTIFEEGWSEVDHDSLYKGEQDNGQIKTTSSILSRLAGTCDELAELMLGRYKNNKVVEDESNQSKNLTNYEDCLQHILKK